MKRRTKRTLAQYAQILTAMLAGALFLVAIEIAAALDAGLIVRKADAAAKREADMSYSRMAINPADEFAGLGADAWRE